MRRRLTTAFSFDSRLLLGLGRDLPPQRLFALGGMGTLRGYPLKGFRGGNAALGTVEGRLRLPQRWPDLIAFYDGGTVWTSNVNGPGYRDDAGFSVEWPGGGEGRLRLDGAYALRPLPGQRRARAYATIILPF
jgi:hemolysin activation/secretion protein